MIIVATDAAAANTLLDGANTSRKKLRRRPMNN
jgi:hypothetical protein